MSNDDVIKVYVGADRSQQLAVKVLEYSIQRHTTAPVEVIPMIDLPVPVPKDPRNGQRTGFSYSRFCIPKLAGYSGRAVYMDADMQVFKDIQELWKLPETPVDTRRAQDCVVANDRAAVACVVGAGAGAGDRVVLFKRP